MNILYFSQFYEPESIAPAFRATENSRLWVQMGHKVTVFTGYPNYPTGKIFPGYVPKLLQRENVNGVTIIRNKLIAKPNTSISRRLQNALSFFLFGLINITVNNEKIGKDFDVVIGTSGVIFNALLAQIYAMLHRIPFVFELRDITYIQMMATGKSEKNVSVKCMKWLELFLCQKAKKVVVVTNGFKKILISNGVPQNKIEVVTNGVDIVNPVERQEMNKNFVLSYFGTLGVSQNIVETFDYAREINKEITNFEYLIIGEGAQKKDIEKKVEGNEYIKIHSGMPLSQLEPYYAKTQMSVITLRKSDNFKYTIPSKLFQIMGRGIAVLFIGPEGETADIIRKNNAGLALTGKKSEDIATLKSFFKQVDWSDKIRKMGENGRLTVEKNYSRTRLAQEYLKILENVRTNND